MSNDFVGIYGNLIHEDYDFIANLFVILSDRLVTTSFPYPIVDNSIKLYFNPSLIGKSVDWTFFLRPFHTATWKFILCLSIVHIGLSFMKQKSYIQMLFSLNGWMFYVFVFAYYSGAQTMFLSSTQKFQISSVLDVIKDKDWNLVLIKNYNTFVNQYASSGIPQFQNLQKQIHSNSYKYMMNTKEVLPLQFQTKTEDM